jgi:hypothetical protein
MNEEHVHHLLHDYVGGSLGADDLAVVEAHLDTCALCREELARTRRLIEGVAKLPRSIAPPADLWPAIQSRMERPAAPPRRPRVRWPARRSEPPRHRRPLRVLWPAAAVAVFLVATGIWWLARPTAQPGWEVITLEGQPRIGETPLAESGVIRPGQRLQTDAVSRAKMDVGTIGHVELAPGTRISLVDARPDHHRIALDQGTIEARIWAPPRLFFVETPSAVAIDLGCVYRLTIDSTGAGLLVVESGWVALEHEKNSTVVPAGAMAATRTGWGPGTPFDQDASDELRRALSRFDFEGGGRGAVIAVLDAAGPYDGITLWHLLNKTEGAIRARVFDRLASIESPPEGVTREGILAGDPQHLKAWERYLGLDYDFVLGDATAPLDVDLADEMSVERAAHQATLLPGGEILITGGCSEAGCTGMVASAERYDPSTETFRPAAPLSMPRAGHVAAPLPDGRVLIGGGWSGRERPDEAEIYDAATNRFTPIGKMIERRGSTRAVALADGRVLFTGGDAGEMAPIASAELFDPESASFIRAGSMGTARSSHAVTLLADGRVLVTGGHAVRRGAALGSAEIFDPATNTFHPTGDMIAPRHKHAAVLLQDGRVLIVGGADPQTSDHPRGRLVSTEIYDPATGAFSTGPNLNYARYKIPDAVTVLSGGEVLVTGDGPRPEIWDPNGGGFVVLPGSLAGTAFATSTLLPSGDVLILGGYDNKIRPSRMAWLVRD